MSKKLLYATDFSQASLSILPYAASLARDREATLLIVHVLEMEDVPVGELFDEDAKPPSEEVERLEAIKPHGIDVPVEHRLVFGEPGSPDQTICKLAEEEEVEMIVIGTHGHSALEGLMGGSIAERVIKHSSRPVVAVKHR